ncbi:MAG: nitroreductase family protein [Giesbergeria sp.]
MQDATSSHALVSGQDCAAFAAALMQARQTSLPKRLGEPAPSTEQLAQIMACAAHAPDHGQLLPWRFIQVPQSARTELAQAFAQALHERDTQATPEQMEQAREKAFRSPVLLLLVVDLACGDPEIEPGERILSAGCAVQNLLLMATALGFGSALTSGKAMGSAPLRTLFGLGDAQQALCFVSIGTVVAPKRARVRPATAAYFSVLGGAADAF